MIINVYKSKGWTSNDVVQKIKGLIGTKKVGHAGTLDPLATGVLIVAIGRESTKKLFDGKKSPAGEEKEYVAKIKFGEESTTDDEEGEKTSTKISDKPTKKEIEKVLKKFIGKIKQVPPIYSAIKIDGRAAYKYARKGRRLEMKPRNIEIKDIEIISFKWPYLKIKTITGPGVYIRSLARDIGRELKVGGYLADLERTRVGQYIIEKSVKIEELIDYFKIHNE